MQILFLDDSFAYDGYTPLNDAMGGPQKGLVHLAEALAARGHDVRVMNRCERSLTIRGVCWQNLDDDWTGDADLAIALRHPRLLERAPAGGFRLLWVADCLEAQDQAALPGILQAFRVDRLVFMGEHHLTSWTGDDGLAMIIRPGISSAYLQPEPPAGYWPPRAITTAHPRVRLAWLLELWLNKIRPMVDEAELHIFSGLLARAASGKTIDSDLRPLWREVEAAADKGVIVRRPLPDADMAVEFRRARVHLHPGSMREAYAATLAESQAAGCPGVTFRQGASQERIRDSRSGFLVPDEAAFANCAILCLKEDIVYRGRSKDAADMQRDRSWDDAAADFEALVHGAESR